MRMNVSLRRFRWLILALPVTAAIAQVGPPPPLAPLGPPPQPPGNPVTLAKSNLGKVLFWDEQLSSTRTVACGSCHQAATGGSDPRSIPGSAPATHPGIDGVLGTADDVTGSPGVPLNYSNGAFEWSETFGLVAQVTGRRAPSHINAAYSPELFWDGRAARVFNDPLSGTTLLANGGALENQSIGPPVSSGEMGHLGRDWTDVAARVQASQPLALATFVPADLKTWIGDHTYPELFADAFGTAAVTPARIAMAIASYERTLFSTQTPFDSLIAGTALLPPQENQGFQLFGRLPCARCHAGSLMSDNQYHYIGVRPAAEDSGRAIVTHAPPDLGRFHTPSLRNVSLRPSFMHNGRFRTLEEVVDFYDRGGDFNAPNKDPRIVPLNLTPVEKAQLLAFLRRPLTDPRVMNSTAPFDRPSLYSESRLVPEVYGAGVPSIGGVAPQPVAIEPPIVGNPTFTVGVYGTLGGAEAVLVLDDVEPTTGTGIPATASFARMPIVLAGSGAGTGYGSATIAIPDDAALEGRVLYGRWYVSDPGAPGGVAASPAFRMQIFGRGGAGVLATEPGSPRIGARTLRLYASQPNPFRPQTLFRYDVFAISRARLVIYDVAGRAVRRLVDEAAQLPGSYSVMWDGRDDAGVKVAGGVYFYRLDGNGGSESRSVIRLD